MSRLLESRRLRATVALAALAALGACGSPAPAAPQAPPSSGPATRLPVAGIGSFGAETFRWRMKVRGIEVARFDQRVTVAAGKARIVSTARLSGVARFFRVFESQAVAIVDGATGATRSTLSEFRGQGKFERFSSRFAADRVHIIRGAETSLVSERRTHAELAPISSETFLLGLRHWRAARGDRAVAVVIGVENMFLVELWAQAVRVLDSPLGERRARELAGTARRLTAAGEIVADAKPRPISVFVSEDAERLPLRVEAQLEGSRVTVVLTEHRSR